jgi:hypothetical protein
MSEVSWRTMMRDHPTGRLLVGVVNNGGSVKLRAALLGRLTRMLQLSVTRRSSPSRLKGRSNSPVRKRSAPIEPPATAG